MNTLQANGSLIEPTSLILPDSIVKALWSHIQAVLPESKSQPQMVLPDSVGAAMQTAGMVNFHSQAVPNGIKIEVSVKISPISGSEMANDGPTSKIEEHIERAFKDYYNPTRLARNPLTKMLDLGAYQCTEDNKLKAEGLALRRALDQVIDAISGLNKSSRKLRRQWRLEHYLHLRYREKKAHQDIARGLQYTVRHLQRKRKEFLKDAATQIFNLSAHQAA